MLYFSNFKSNLTAKNSKYEPASQVFGMLVFACLCYLTKHKNTINIRNQRAKIKSIKIY